jgi:hypothetical protein
MPEMLQAREDLRLTSRFNHASPDFAGQSRKAAGVRSADPSGQEPTLPLTMGRISGLAHHRRLVEAAGPLA